VEGGVVLVEPFEVPDGADEPFLDAWERLRAARAQQRGYLGSRLYRRAGSAELRFVDVTRWSSPLMFARALKLPAVEEAVAAMPFASHPALYIAAR
jgi:heme-degrading monooxygenase HmoA